ncbi:MAG: hypothetical protein GY861_15935 [bacterium]|nr:hypothetical protein [bacterium]
MPAQVELYTVEITNISFMYELGTLSATLGGGAITGVTIDTAGIGQNSTSISISGDGTGAVLTPTVDESGIITSVAITNGGADYTTATLTVVATQPSGNIYLKWSADDGATWNTADTYAITTSEQDFSTLINETVGQVKLEYDGGLKTRLKVFSMIGYGEEEVDKGVKIVPFVFNLDQKYVLVLTDEVIHIYENDVFLESKAATGLLSTLFDTLKVTQAEDTMIFTHPDLQTKQLVRSQPGGTLTWTFGNFPWINIPKDAFGNESTTNPAQTLTPSATEGAVKLTAGGAVFDTDSVGQLIDGNGGRVRITEYVSTTVVFGYTTIPFYTADAIGSGEWDYITGFEDVWSSDRGYPSSCLFYQQRLWFGGSQSKPNTIWASRVGQFNNFNNVGNYDNDAINVTISSEQIDEIINIYANRGIQVFTAGAEWLISEANLTPDTISLTKNTSNGSLATVDPVDISGVTLFVEKNGKSLLSFVYAETEAAYSSSSISLLTDLVQNPISMAVDYNSSQDIGNFLYMVMNDGTMAVWCIMLDNLIVSPVRWEADSGIITDIINVAGDNYMLVIRGHAVYLEKITAVKTDFTTITTTRNAVISDLDDYNLTTIHAYSASTDYGDFTVEDGTITLPSTPTEDVNIGYDFDYLLTSNPIAINGQTNNIDKRIAKATVVTSDTPELTFCSQTLTQTDDVYDFYGVTGFSRDTRFSISGTFDTVEVLSVLLNINYGEK